ncbi:Na+/H+ antiporter NhaC [Natranaerobius thermophilus]|uniref:Na+/H+ antiporter NhaC n=1 Tax=Natranaerobius thermophilus (strain ATCC BAA-1301 / DSM 18059 / JW/NM-WN-LF) TaxID=457570 RepID=B2A5Y9_NATTJ|nr:Na+/H+ antiporter NhaC [Natranaerobius thermophilus]ACB85406.1 Na+/H+ antiporter NhaC [Natranaerobius thermophilus JW/NM-WN-LF]
MNKEHGRSPSFLEALIGLILIITVIVGTIRIELVLETPLVLGSVTAALFGLYLGYSWDSIQEGMIDGIRNGLIACLILIIVGMVVGTWILGGTIQTLIYYGLQFLSPTIFLPATFLLCAITSLFIGSSFGTIATMGLVLLGVGGGLGIPAGMTAGAIASGAIFGDKMSPLSDSTNLASAMTGANLFDHIGSMLWVTAPATIISLILYTIIGLGQSGGAVDLQEVNTILETLQSNFNITLLTLIPPVLVLILSIKKVPALATLMISFFAGSLIAVITQGASLSSIITVSASGYEASTGVEFVDELLTHGGINMMMGTVAMILAGTAMGGILERCGVLKVLLNGMLQYVKTPRGLILSTLASAYIMLLASAEMMVSIIVPGRTFQPAYNDMNVELSVLSRTLESAATLGCIALPWGVASVYLQGVLDVGFEFIPYTFISFLAPVIVIIYAVTNTGFGHGKKLERH